MKKAHLSLAECLIFGNRPARRRNVFDLDFFLPVQDGGFHALNLKGNRIERNEDDPIQSSCQEVAMKPRLGPFVARDSS
jgi:hypothetical protein